MPLPRGFESQLFRTADELRAGSKLTPAEYQLPVLSLLFRKYADEGFSKAHAKLSARKRRAAPEPEDYRAEGAVYLRPEHRWGALVLLPDSADLGKILNDAMRAIEEDNDALKGVLPRDYGKIDKVILRDLLKALNVLEESPEGDVYGRVYEYFLGAFAPETLQKGGEYFTPFSVVRLIVEILEPFEGRIFDPACGSGGMFVQSARFVAEHKGKGLSVFGQEKTRQTIQLCRMNLAVHGLNGTVKEVTSSLYEFPVEKEVKEGFDFVMSNPPFNLKGVDKTRLKDDRKHYPWGVSGGDNANYLWIQRFYSALNENGRAGFVMANSASDAGGKDLEVRKELVKSGAVDVIVTLTPNLFYTVTLPVTLWFFDRAKAKGPRADEVLFIDARQVFEQVDRAHRTLTPEHIEFLSNIVRVWRGRTPEDHHGGLAKTREALGASGYRDVEGLCKKVSRGVIEQNRWSLNPGRYVGVEAKVDETEVALQERLMELQEEFETLTAEARGLEEKISSAMTALVGG